MAKKEEIKITALYERLSRMMTAILEEESVKDPTAGTQLRLAISKSICENSKTKQRRAATPNRSTLSQRD